MTKLPAKAGLNRFVWDLRSPGREQVQGPDPVGGRHARATVAPGAYQVRFTAGGKTMTEPLEIAGDPRLPATAEDYQKQFDLLLKIRDKLTETHDAVNADPRGPRPGEAVADHAKAAGGDDAIAKAAEALDQELTAIEEALYQTKNQSSQDPLNFPIRLNNKLASLAGVVASADVAPTASVLRGLRRPRGEHRRRAREAGADPRQGPGRLQPARAGEDRPGGGAEEARDRAPVHRSGTGNGKQKAPRPVCI